jgi:hypothetical protein
MCRKPFSLLRNFMVAGPQKQAHTVKKEKELNTKRTNIRAFHHILGSPTSYMTLHVGSVQNSLLCWEHFPGF